MNKKYCTVDRRTIMPSIIYYCEGIFKSLANSSVLNSGFVKNPITNEVVEIDSYRFMDGIEIDQGLICSIYPSFSSYDSSPPSPATISASSIYTDDFSLGSTEREVLYHLIIKYTYKEVNIDSLSPSVDNYLIKVNPPSADPKRFKYVSKNSREVNLYHNPPLSIISEYLELTRMVLLDNAWISKFFDCTNLDIRYLNYPSIDWSSGINSYFNEGHILVAITSHIRVGWTDKFILPANTFNLTTNNAHQP